MQAPTVVAVGDSVTHGIGDGVQESDGNVGWAYYVSVALGASSFTNFAANGVRARHLLDQQVPAALALRPDVVLLTVGGNDVLRSDFEPAEIRAHTREAIDQFRAAGAHVVLISLSRISLFDLFRPSVQRVMARRIERANEALAAATVGTGAHVIDGAHAMAQQGAPFWHVDRIHPSPLGHRHLADLAVELLPFPRVAATPPPTASPALSARAWWLIRKGVPWIAKRSRDMIPGVTKVILADLREERRARRRGPQHVTRPGSALARESGAPPEWSPARRALR